MQETLPLVSAIAVAASPFLYAWIRGKRRRGALKDDLFITADGQEHLIYKLDEKGSRRTHSAGSQAKKRKDPR